MASLQRLFSISLILLGLIAQFTPAQAGVFNTPHFVQPGLFAIGLEPEMVFSSRASLGVNLRYTHGITDLINLSALVGTGTGPRSWRGGLMGTFDIFPDIEGQPGIGISAQTFYYRLDVVPWQLDVLAVPYIHKTFHRGDGIAFEPFLAFPVGVGFQSDTYDPLATMVVGSMFHRGEHISFSLELGVAVNNTDSYLSGGFVYRY